MRSFLIHLIRHGQTDGNLNGLYIGRTDLPVTANGIAALEEMRDSGIYPGASRLYTGPLSRCVQSAEVLFPSMIPTVIDELTEYNFGDFEGKGAAELESDPQYLEWTSGRRKSTPNGEATDEFAKRVCVGLSKIVKDLGDHDCCDGVAVLHGGVIMTILAAAGLPRRPLYEWATDYGRGYTIRITPSLYYKSGVVEIIGEI